MDMHWAVSSVVRSVELRALWMVATTADKTVVKKDPQMTAQMAVLTDQDSLAT